jgi:hypothetical protein
MGNVILKRWSVAWVAHQAGIENFVVTITAVSFQPVANTLKIVFRFILADGLILRIGASANLWWEPLPAVD